MRSQIIIKKTKKAGNTNWISPIKPSPDTMVNTSSKTIVTKNDIIAEPFNPKPESKLSVKTSTNDGKNKKVKIKRINNRDVKAIKIFLDSFLSLISLSSIILFTFGLI